MKSRNEKGYSHLNLLFGWIVYFALFLVTENCIPPEACTPVYTPLDDSIPFWEGFLIPYVLWYGWIVFSLLWMLRHHVDGFRCLQIYFTLVQLVAMVIYISFPNRQDLRPEVFPRDNILSRGVALLYSVDTNTGVCPSMHVALSLGMVSAWLKEREVGWFWKVAAVVFGAAVCLSTVFLKQHSVLDFFAALPLCLLAEIIAYGKSYWLPRMKRN